MPLPPSHGGYETGSPGHVFALIRNRIADTRASLARATGLARSTVAARVEALIEHGLLAETEDGTSTGGRPPKVLRIRTEGNLVAGIDLGATEYRIGLLDLSGRLLAHRQGALRVSDGPEPVLTHLDAELGTLLSEVNAPADWLRLVGIGVPGPVEFATGRPINPPIMPGWHEYPVPEFFTSRYSTSRPPRVLVDNDVNVLALGTHRVHHRDHEHLLYVKVGTGIGCGIITGGLLHRGAAGCAGDIGHIRISDPDETVCRCGNTGCLEAVAGGGGLARALTEAGYPAEDVHAVVAQVTAGNPEALRLLRRAGRLLGEVLAGLVNFHNPRAVVIGGALATASDHLVAGVREVVYGRSLPLATQGLEITVGRSTEPVGVLGAGRLVIEEHMSVDRINQALSP